MSDGVLSIRNWERFQHYKDRRPVWVKLYVEILDDYDMSRLPAEDLGHLVRLWCLAARMDNRIPLDPAWIGRQLNTDTAAVEAAIARLSSGENAPVVVSGAACSTLPEQPASTPLAFARSRETEEEPREEGEPTGSLSGTARRATADIERVWAAYQGHHPKANLTKARRALIGRRLTEYPVDTLVAAVEGQHRSPFHQGENRQGTKYLSLELALRDAAHIEQFAGLAAEKARAATPTVPCPDCDGGWLDHGDTMERCGRCNGFARIPEAA